MSKKKTATKNQADVKPKAPEQPDDEVLEKVLDQGGGESDAQESTGETNQDSQIEDLKEQLAKQAEEVAQLKDAFLRAKAEEENVRRRAEKEVANGRKFAVEGFAKELLNVRDSLTLAAAVTLQEDDSDSVKSMKEGVDITLKQLDTALAKFAVQEIAAKPGDPLDPHLHQAMSMIESDEVDSGAIVNVIQAGFTMHDRLLRPCLVVVAQ